MLFLNSTEISDEALVNGVLGAVLAIMVIFIVFITICAILEIIGMWKTFDKAKQPGWAAIIPFYNLFVQLKVANMQWWHLIIIIAISILSSVDNNYVEFASYVALITYQIIIGIKISRAFGKSDGFGIMTGILPFIGYMILGCGSAKYEE